MNASQVLLHKQHGWSCSVYQQSEQLAEICDALSVLEQNTLQQPCQIVLHVQATL